MQRASLACAVGDCLIECLDSILDEVCLLKNVRHLESYRERDLTLVKAQIRYFLRAEDEARPPQIGGHLGEYIPAPHPVTGVVEYYIYAPNAVKVLDLPSPSSFNVAMTPDNIGLIKAVTAHALLPTMREELAHARQPDVVVMNPPPVYRNPCDCCRTATFNASFICSHCGR